MLRLSAESAEFRPRTQSLSPPPGLAYATAAIATLQERIDADAAAAYTRDRIRVHAAARDAFVGGIPARVSHAGTGVRYYVYIRGSLSSTQFGVTAAERVVVLEFNVDYSPVSAATFARAIVFVYGGGPVADMVCVGAVDVAHARVLYDTIADVLRG